MLSSEEFEKQMGIIDNSAGAIFVKFRLDHMRYLKGNGSAAAVLAYMLNLLHMKNRNQTDRCLLKKNDLWFKCPANGIQKETGMTKDRQQGALTVLTSHGIIETDRRAGNAIWVRINTSKLVEIEANDYRQKAKAEKNSDYGKPVICGGKTRNPDCGKSAIRESRNLEESAIPSAEISGKTPPKNLSKKQSKHSRPKSADGASGFAFSHNGHSNGKASFGRTSANRLYDALIKKDKIMRSPKLADWGKAIDEFVKRLMKRKDCSQEAAEKRFGKALDWYLPNIGNKWVVRAYSAETFCGEFVRIEDAMNKDKLPETSDSNTLRPDEVW